MVRRVFRVAWPTTIGTARAAPAAVATGVFRGAAFFTTWRTAVLLLAATFFFVATFFFATTFFAAFLTALRPAAFTAFFTARLLATFLADFALFVLAGLLRAGLADLRWVFFAAFTGQSFREGPSDRSAERRVGKESVSKCRYRRAAVH